MDIFRRRTTNAIRLLDIRVLEMPISASVEWRDPLEVGNKPIPFQEKWLFFRYDDVFEAQKKS